jgi:hypothetical protein
VVRHLLAVPAVADPDDHAPARQPVHRRDLLRERDRVVLRDERDSGAEPDARRDRGGCREHRPRVEAALVLLGELGVSGGRRRAAAHRDVGVLRHVERREAARLGLARELDGAHRQVGRVDRDAEAHAVEESTLAERCTIGGRAARGRRRGRAARDPSRRYRGTK